MWQGTRLGLMSVLVLAACAGGSHDHLLSEASGQRYQAAPLAIHSRPSAARTTCAARASFSPSPKRSYAVVVRLAATAPAGK
jgi:hypothetical protein